MKKIILLASFGVAGLVCGKTNEVVSESNIDFESKLIYNPIKITSSCGYTQYVTIGPLDQPDCWLTDAQQMEEECAASFENPLLAGMW